MESLPGLPERGRRENPSSGGANFALLRRLEAAEPGSRHYVRLMAVIGAATAVITGLIEPSPMALPAADGRASLRPLRLKTTAPPSRRQSPRASGVCFPCGGDLDSPECRFCSML